MKLIVGYFIIGLYLGGFLGAFLSALYQFIDARKMEKAAAEGKE